LLWPPIGVTGSSRVQQDDAGTDGGSGGDADGHTSRCDTALQVVPLVKLTPVDMPTGEEEEEAMLEV
jgi:hypothetical protein